MKTNDNPTVEIVPGERLRFIVQSETKENTQYMVDLEENHPIGWCNCEDYEYRKAILSGPREALTFKAMNIVQGLRCKHIKLIREVIANDLIHTVVFNNGPEVFRNHWRELRTFSARRKFMMNEYYKRREEFLPGRMCAVFPRLKAVDVHHSRGRAGYLLLDTRFWIAVSRAGHKWIHENPKEAQSRGFLAHAGEWNKPEKQERYE